MYNIEIIVTKPNTLVRRVTIRSVGEKGCCNVRKNEYWPQRMAAGETVDCLSYRFGLNTIFHQSVLNMSKEREPFYSDYLISIQDIIEAFNKIMKILSVLKKNIKIKTLQLYLNRFI